MSVRSPLGRVLGMGSAKDGTAHWWAQRVTAIALAPLTLWLFFSLLLLPGLDYSTVKAWLSLPVSSFLAILTIGVLAHHAYLGSAVIIEDYVHGAGLKVLWLVTLRFSYVLCAGAGVFAVLRVAFGS